jgi:tRNA (guanine-N7-)-methyltransferase
MRLAMRSVLPPGHRPPPADPHGLVVWSESEPERLDLPALFDRADGGRPVELEVGFGKGRFLLAAAQRWPERDFLAVDYTRALVRKVRDRVVRLGLTNVRLYKGDAKHLVTKLLAPGSLARVHVYFPDPWPKRRHAKHRFFADPIPDAIGRVLRPGGELLFVTDHEPYLREVVARLRSHEAFVGVLPDVFADIPPSGFEAIFAARDVPTFRAAWQTVRAGVTGKPHRG